MYTCPSQDDYYGYEEIEYTVLDLDGNESTELEKLVTAKDDERIQDQISAYYNSNPFEDECIHDL